MNKFIILVWNANRQVTTIGTPLGRPYNSEKAAERTVRKLEAQCPGLSFIICELEPSPL